MRIFAVENNLQMEHDGVYDDENTNGPSPETPQYRLLGESGLVEDEEGNIYSASEVYGFDEPINASEVNGSDEPINASKKTLDSFLKNSFVSALDDKANPAYWYHYYDPRYCGPSREAYMEEMAQKYRKSTAKEPEQINTQKEPEKHPPRVLSEPPKKNDCVAPKAATEQTVWERKSEKRPDPVFYETAAEKSDTKRPDPVLFDTSAEKSDTKQKEFADQVIPEAERVKADSEQREVDRLGLRPLWNQHKNGPSFAGIVNRNNEVVISEEKYSLIGPFNNGLAVAQNRKTRKFGFVDRHGNEVIPCIWHSAGPFSEYMAGVLDDNKKCGYVDVTGRLAVPCKWKEGWTFHEGLARVQEGLRIGMVDRRGRLVIPCVWLAMGDCSEGLIGVRDADGKCGYVDRTGKVVIPCRWKQVWTFSEGRAVVQDFNKRLGFVDKSGELVIPCRWKKADHFKDGLAKVSDSKTFLFQDKWVYIDRQGRVVK